MPSDHGNQSAFPLQRLMPHSECSHILCPPCTSWLWHGKLTFVGLLRYTNW